MQDFRCLVCRDTRSEPVFRDCEDYYLRKPYRVDYHRCQSCNLVQQFPIPSNISDFYNAYPVHQQKGVLLEVMRKLVMAPVYFNPKKLPKGSVLVDYGCGDGWFLDAHRDQGLDLIGYEPDAEHAARLNSRLALPVYSDLNQLLEKHAGTADVVTMHFVLEHLPDLHGAFETVRKLLKPGGTFYFVVPHIHSVEASLFKKKWHNLDPPRHLSFPTEETTRKLAQEHGFDLVKAKPLPFPNGFAGSLPVWITGKFSFLLFLLFLPLGILFSRLIPNGTFGYWVAKAS